MKSLKESLLNRNKVTGNTLDNMYKDELKKKIEEFIYKYYVIFLPGIDIVYDDSLGLFVVNAEQIENKFNKCKDLKSLTGGLPFTFGNIELFELAEMHNLESLEGSPMTCDKMSITRCGLKNLKGIGDVKERLEIIGCADFESLEDCPKNLKFIRLSTLPKLKSLKGISPKTRRSYYKIPDGLDDK